MALVFGTSRRYVKGISALSQNASSVRLCCIGRLHLKVGIELFITFITQEAVQMHTFASCHSGAFVTVLWHVLLLFQSQYITICWHRFTNTYIIQMDNGQINYFKICYFYRVAATYIYHFLLRPSVYLSVTKSLKNTTATSSKLYRSYQC